MLDSWVRVDMTLPFVFCRMKLMYNHVNPKNDQPSPLIAEDVYQIIMDVRALGCSP